MAAQLIKQGKLRINSLLGYKIGGARWGKTEVVAAAHAHRQAAAQLDSSVASTGPVRPSRVSQATALEFRWVCAFPLRWGF